MIPINDILVNDASVARSLGDRAASTAVSSGARAAACGAMRIGDREMWTFQRTEDVESLLALLGDCRRHWNPSQNQTYSHEKIHSVNRLIVKLTATLL
jgi:hypothetical protein